MDCIQLFLNEVNFDLFIYFQNF